MKNHTKKSIKASNGITLIALVITIIVLLILAGVSISMLSGDNSILKRLGESERKTTSESDEEQVKLSVLAALTDGKGILNGNTLKNEIKKNLSGVTDNNIMGDETSGWQVRKDNRMYIISPKGEVTEGFWEEIKDANGNVTEIRRIDETATGLHIGDKIGYSAIDGVSSENRTITSLGTVTGMGEGNNQIIQIEAGTWKLLGVENGKLKIISDIVGRTTESGEDGVYANKVLKIFGKIGHQNAEEELNRVCSLYGKGKYAESGRSVNVEDINKITGYNPNAVGIKNPTAEQIASGTKYGQGDSLAQYGREVTYLWSENQEKLLQYTYDGLETPGNLWEDDSFNWFDGKKWNISNYKEGKPGEICKLKTDYYKYYPTTLTTDNFESGAGINAYSDEYNLLFNKSNYADGGLGYYWLASKCIRSDVGRVLFCIRYVRLRVDCIEAKSNERGLGLRPVVFLKSDIKMEKDENEVWQILDN